MDAPETKLYLAYGSNLNIRQMAVRCPSAQVVGSDTLKDYRLLFRGHVYSAVATVEPFEGGLVPVLIWEITPEDEAELDVYEGFPSFYRKETMQTRLNGETHDAMIYIMNVTDTDGRIRHLNKPNRYYYDIILEGYRQLTTDMKLDGFDINILNEAVENSVQPECEINALIEEQIMAIRNSGETNMFDIRTVREIASREGFTELERYLTHNRRGHEYAQFILTGKINNKRPNG